MEEDVGVPVTVDSMSNQPIWKGRRRSYEKTTEFYSLHLILENQQTEVISETVIYIDGLQ